MRGRVRMRRTMVGRRSMLRRRSRWGGLHRCCRPAHGKQQHRRQQHRRQEGSCACGRHSISCFRQQFHFLALISLLNKTLSGKFGCANAFLPSQASMGTRSNTAASLRDRTFLANLLTGHSYRTTIFPFIWSWPRPQSMLQRITYVPACPAIRRTTAGLPLLTDSSMSRPSTANPCWTSSLSMVSSTLAFRAITIVSGTISQFFISTCTRWSGGPVNAGLLHPASTSTQVTPTSQITHFAVRRHAHLV